jgi:hypothetical protein
LNNGRNTERVWKEFVFLKDGDIGRGRVGAEMRREGGGMISYDAEVVWGDAMLGDVA